MLGQVLSYNNIRDIIKFCKEEKLVLLADEVDMLNKHSFAESVDLCIVVMRSWQAFCQMGIQVSCGQPLFLKKNIVSFCVYGDFKQAL